MAWYDMVCDDCGHAFEHSQSIKAPLIRTCPECGAEALTQDYANKQLTINDGVCRTVGQQAEKNAKEMGREAADLEARRALGPKAVAKKEAKTPWFRPEGSKPLDLSTVKDQTKFILTGDKT